MEDKFKPDGTGIINESISDEWVRLAALLLWRGYTPFRLGFIIRANDDFRSGFRPAFSKLTKARQEETREAAQALLKFCADISSRVLLPGALRFEAPPETEVGQMYWFLQGLAAGVVIGGES